MPAPFILGWEEWLALPELGLPAIKAKVDTGARTSALHAFLVEPFGPATAPKVRFGIHPIPGRDDIEVYCSAPVVDRREVTSSNGEKETRFVIATMARIGDLDWPVEVSLTNRETMAYRMLLGRQAIREDMFVDPASSFRQPKLSYKLYRHLPRRDPVRRSLRIALLTSRPAAPSARLLEEAASARGHVLEVLDVDRLTLSVLDGRANITSGGAAVGHYDAVIARISGRRRAAALRQLELMGSFSLTPADAVARLTDRVAVEQVLLRSGIPVADFEVHLAADEHDATPPPREKGTRLEFVVAGEAVVAIVETRHGRESDVGERALKSERRMAVSAARVLGLGLAVVTIVRERDRLLVAHVSALPSLPRIERITGVQLAVEIMAAMETRVRSWIRREPALPVDDAAIAPDDDDG